MSKKSCQEKPPRIPLAYKGIQVNCCKFTRCENFGLTPEDIEEKILFNNHNKKESGRQPVKPTDFYTISGTGYKSASINCKGCREFQKSSPYVNQKTYSIKSNKGVYEEYERIGGYLEEAGERCVNQDCESNLGTKPVSIKKRGKTPKGTQRFFCNVCKTSFTGQPIDRVHGKSEIDIFFFKALVSKTPLARIAKLFDISMPTLYRRIDFIYRKCVEFVANRERRLIKKKFELRKRSVFVSGSGVRSIWLRHDLENFKKRLKALEAKVASDGIILTDSQIAALEKKKHDDEACGEIETLHPGYLGSQDTFYVGNLKGVGRIYQQTFIDTYSKVAFAKLYTTKTPITAADALNDKVLPFFEQHELPMLRILTDRGTEYCGKVEHHDYQLYLAINDIDHTKTKAMSPQTNGICERFHKTILNEFYQVTFRKKLYSSLEELQKDLDEWVDYYNNERTHQGKMCCGRTPIETLVDGKQVWAEKNLAQI